MGGLVLPERDYGTNLVDFLADGRWGGGQMGRAEGEDKGGTGIRI